MIKSYMENAKIKIDREIEKFLELELEKYEKHTEKVKSLIDVYKRACYGGKRIRGALVKMGYEILSGEETDEIYKASAAYELFQTGILIHDDIIDKSDLRRGRPSVHVELGGDHLAMSNAICLGDLGMFLSYKTLSEVKLEPSKVLKAINFYAETLNNTVIGEILDVNLPFADSIIEKNVLDISYLKTAWYTIIGPLSVGMILAGADEDALSAAKRFGTYAGIAFQIKDDILGIYGDASVLGKSVTSDIEEKKLTLMYNYAMKNANKEEKEKFSSVYGTKVMPEEYQYIKEFFKKIGAYGYATNRMEEYTQMALAEISKVTQDAGKQKLLEEFTYYLIKREK